MYIEYILYICLLGVQGSLGSFGACPNFDDLVSRKRLVVEQTDQNLGLWSKYLVYTKYFDC